MSAPYGGNQPPQWGQPAGPESGGFPGQGGGYPPQPQYDQFGQPLPPGAQPGYGQPPQPGYGAPQQPQQPYQAPQPGAFGQPPQQQPPTSPDSGGFPGQGSGYPPQPQYDQFGQPLPPGAQPGYGQPPQPHQPYGQPPPGAPQRGKSGGGKGLWIGIGALVVAIGAAAVVLFVWPGVLNTTVFDHQQMQSDIQKVLSDPNNGYGIPNVESVTCPSGQEVTKGSTFTCDVTVGGKQQTVQVTVNDNEGGYRVGKPQPKG